MVWKNDQVSEVETREILKLAYAVMDRGVPGDIVELGCYKGDTALMLAEVLRGRESMHEEETGLRKLWIYDSFEGLPEKSSFDESALGANFKQGELCVTKREVKERFLRAGLKVPVIKKGWFSDLTQADLPAEICVAFLDGDFYESIRDSFRLIENLMSEGGVIMVHDYNNPALPGVAKAVDEWMREKNLKIRVVETMAIIGF